jgi:drug/metabolite transporter (DMT)-like permease
VTFIQAGQLVLLGAIWGASFLFMRVAAPEFGPLALITVRVGSAALFLIGPLLHAGEWKSVRAHAGKLLLLGAINSAIPFTLFAYVTLTLKAGEAAVLNATVPLFSALLGALVFRQRLPWSGVFGLGLGFVGVVILVRHKLNWSGDALAVPAGLFAALLYATSAHFSSRMLKGVSPLTVSTGSLTFATLLLLPLALAFPPAAAPSTRGWVFGIALGVLCSAIAYLLFFRLIRGIGPARATTVTYLIPAFAIVWGWLLLGENITPSMMLGGVIIVVGTMMVNLPPRSLSPPADTTLMESTLTDTTLNDTAPKET